MKINSILFFILSIFFTFESSKAAGNFSNVSVDDIKICGGHSENLVCIGASENNCKAKSISINNYDEWGIQMLIVRETNASGVEICPMQLNGHNKNKKDTWGGAVILDKNKCVWLCKDGYTGGKCQTDTTLANVTDCSDFSLKLDTYKNLEVSSSVDSDTSAYIISKEMLKCSGNIGEAHYMIWGVSELTNSGKGAWVEPMTWRVAREGYENMDSWSVVSVIDSSKYKELLCLNGYKINDEGTDCEPINSEFCTEESEASTEENLTEEAMCEGFALKDYNSTIHEIDLQYMNYSDYGALFCVKYSCKESGKGFASSSDKSCVECPDNKGKIDEKTGICITCSSGQYFDEDDGICKTAVAYSKSDMQYGKGETKNTVPLAQQCWLIATPEEYAECVKNDGKRPYSPSNSTQIMTQSIF